MRKRFYGTVLVLAAVMAIGGAGEASAVQLVGPDGKRDYLPSYVKAAEKHWNRPVPPNVEIAIGRTDEPQDIAAYAYTLGYKIVLNPIYWTPTISNLLNGCVVIVHEVGHMHGESDSGVPGDVMGHGEGAIERANVPSCARFSWSSRHRRWHRIHPHNSSARWSYLHRRWHATS